MITIKNLLDRLKAEPQMRLSTKLPNLLTFNALTGRNDGVLLAICFYVIVILWKQRKQIFSWVRHYFN